MALSLVTRGFGSFGSVNLVVTRGYVPPGVAATVTVHDGGDGATKRELDALRKRHRQASRATEDKRLVAERRLGEALAKAYAKVLGREPEQDAEWRVAEAVGLPAASQGLDWETVAKDMALARRAIAAIEAEMVRIWADEDDLELLLLAA